MVEKTSMPLGDHIKAEDGGWKFQGKAVSQFDEHIGRSVPLYKEGHQLICRMSDHFIQDDSVICDIGCSTGELLLQLAQFHKNRQNCRFVGIDSEPEMIELAKTKCAELKLDNVEFICDDLLKTEIPVCDMLVSYYTLQFIRPRNRQQMIDKIYKSLNWGGSFFMYEKVRGADARFQDLLTSVYTDYKLDQGHSPEEIIGKSKSLKGVLEPFSTQGNLDLLNRAGFIDMMTIQKMICFEGFLAIK